MVSRYSPGGTREISKMPFQYGIPDPRAGHGLLNGFDSRFDGVENALIVGCTHIFGSGLEGDRLTGSMTMGDGEKMTWSGTRAPSLRRAGQPAWGEPLTLFNGKSLDGWQPVGRPDNQWTAAGGILQNAKSGANLVTVQKFDDFKRHVEFRVPKDANSGVYVRGRYELPLDDAAGPVPSSPHLRTGCSL